MKTKLPKLLHKNIGGAKLKSKEQAALFSLLADLLKVGFSMRQAINFTQTLLPQHAGMLLEIDRQMASGATFAVSIQRFVNRDIYYQLKIAEQHGNLQQTITQLGNFLNLKVRQQTKLRGLLQYPVILLCLLGMLLLALKIFVFPELAVWQDDQGVGTGRLKFLPWLWGAIAVIVIALVLSTIYKWMKTSTMNRVNLLCQLPLLGRSYRQYYGYYLVTNFALLLQNGMGIKSICQMVRQFDETSLLHQLGEVINQTLNSGQSPNQLIEQYPYLPRELVVFMNKGESVTDLGYELEIFAQMLFKRLMRSIEQLLTFVQPLLFGIIAIVIVGMYLSIMLPIYQSMKGIY